MIKKKLNISDIKNKKFKNPLIVLTAYTAPLAEILDKYCDIILVGDSVGMVLHGMKNTSNVTLDMMIMHAKAVKSRVKNTIVVVDMPINTYENNQAKALSNAKKIMRETNCDAVKVEGGLKIYKTVEMLVKNKIPVMGHIGLLPQSVKKESDYRAKGRDLENYNNIIRDAIALQEAGVFSVVIECVIKELADKINRIINIPTIGIGASNTCDGQVLVTADILGITKKVPKFVKVYDQLNTRIENNIKKYVRDLKLKKFPSKNNYY
jgi:3-methyl-2-oxobutanoate hydroxymethyltransferase